MIFVHSEVGTPMGFELVEFFETSGVEESVYAFSGRELAFGVLFFNSGFTATYKGVRSEGLKPVQRLLSIVQSGLRSDCSQATAGLNAVLSGQSVRSMSVQYEGMTI